MKKIILSLAILFAGVACAGKTDLPKGSSVFEVTTSNFDSVFKSQDPVVVDVYADWCSPCKKFGTIFTKVSSQSNGKYRFAKLNIDKIGKQGDALNVNSIPAVIFIKNGKEVAREVGFMDEAAFKKKLAKHLGS